MVDSKPTFDSNGPRKKGDYIWVDLEGVEDVMDPPVGLAQCLSDEAEGKVEVQWYAKLFHQKKLLNGNRQFGKHPATNMIDKNNILGVRPDLTKQSTSHCYISRPSCEALVRYCKEERKKKRSGSSVGSSVGSTDRQKRNKV